MKTFSFPFERLNTLLSADLFRSLWGWFMTLVGIRSCGDEWRAHVILSAWICLGVILGLSIQPIFAIEEIRNMLMVGHFGLVVPAFVIVVYFAYRIPFNRVDWLFITMFMASITNLHVIYFAGDIRVFFVNYITMCSVFMYAGAHYQFAPKRIIIASFLCLCIYSAVGYFLVYPEPGGIFQLSLAYGFLLVSIVVGVMFQSLNYRLGNALRRSNAQVVEIRRSNEMLDVVLQAREFGILCYTLDGTLLLSHGASPGEFLGLSDRSKYESLASLAEAMTRKTGRNFSASISKGGPIKIGERFIGFSSQKRSDLRIVTFMDLTEQVKTQTKLRQSQKLNVIGELTSGVAHNYNNMLAIALTNLEAFPNSQHPELWNTMIRPAIEAIAKSAEISHKLLKLAGRQKLVNEMIDAQELLVGMRALIKTMLGPAVTLKIAEGRSGKIVADRRELESALLNLCLNAKNAMKGGGTVTLSAQSDGGHVKFCVEDNGPGVPREIRHRIFDPFFTTGPAQNSTGLGLSTIKGFAEQSGGFLRLEPSPIGARFVLGLPRTGGEKAIKSTEVQPAKDSKGLSVLRDVEILAVDDNEQLILAIGRLLRLSGAHYFGYTDVHEALAKIEEPHSISVAFLDLSMDMMDGITLGKKIRAKSPGIELVLVTGEATAKQIAEATASGFREVIIKPLRIEEVARTVREVKASAERAA